MAAAPKSAKKTKSGLAYRVLQKGKGKDRPTADNTVEVHYSGWTTDGKMFDSSVARDTDGDLPAQGRDPGLDRGCAADDGGGEDAVLDPVEPGLRG